MLNRVFTVGWKWADVIASLWQKSDTKSKKRKKERKKKIVKIDSKNLHILWTTARSFNETIKKDVSYNNNKSHKKPGVYPIYSR